MNRALRAATIGVLLFSPVALSACSAGQVAQTATQERDKTGSMAKVGNLTLRQIALAYPSDGRYEAGDDAELQMAIANESEDDDTLISIEGEGFDSVEVTAGGASSPTGGTAATSPSASTPPSPPTSTSPSPSPSATDSQRITIPAESTVFFGERGGPTAMLIGLTEELTAAQAVTLTLTFERAGEVTVMAIVNTPSRDLPRGEQYNFDQEENQGNEENNEVSGGGNPESGG